MPYKKKPAPEHLSPSQKKEWEYAERLRAERSYDKDSRTMKDIAPPVESMAPPKSAKDTAKEGSKRQSDTEKMIQDLRDNPIQYIKKDKK